jgi:ferredoxin
MNPETLLPVVDDQNCTACNACVVACPRNIIELRKKNKKDRKIYVACINEEKGGVARKNCKVACIGCGKCVKVCPYEAITLKTTSHILTLLNAGYAENVFPSARPMQSLKLGSRFESCCSRVNEEK